MRWDDPLIRSLRRYVGDPMHTSGGEVRFNSPFIEKFNKKVADKGHHLYVNAEKGLFICYKSSLAGSISYLFRLLGTNYEAAAPKIPELSELTMRISELDKIEPPEIPKVILPDWAVPVRDQSPIHYYLHNRGVTNDDIVLYNLMEGVGEFLGTVLIPSFGSKGECDFWVSRKVDSIERYRNPDSPRRYHVGFLEVALQYSPKSITLCEGVFSAIVGGVDCVAAYGKFVTQSQLELISKRGVEELYVALDGDAFKEAVETAKRALSMGFKRVGIVPLPHDKDPADIGRVAFQELKAAAEFITPVGLLKKRLDRV